MIKTWLEAATYCEEVYGSSIVEEKDAAYFQCPECGEMLFREDWQGHNWRTCPVCDFEFAPDELEW